MRWRDRVRSAGERARSALSGLDGWDVSTGGGLSGLGAGVWVEFGIGWALMVCSALLLAAGVLATVGPEWAAARSRRGRG